MHNIEETIEVVRSISKFRREELKNYELIKVVCSYFDKIKEEQLSSADLKFLKEISNLTGIPHYYDLLEKFNDENIEFEKFDLNTLACLIHESTLHTDEFNKLHRFQQEVLNHFNTFEENRYFLSASTSFGKTHLIYEIIKKMKYKNIALIFPTIALLTENLERLYSDKNYEYFAETYSIHTLSDVEIQSEYNIFIYTPERFLSFVDIHKQVEFDFVFVDEIYKMDNDYLIDETTRENERDTAYRIALFSILQCSEDILLAGPYIEFSNEKSDSYNSSFDKFVSINGFEVLNFNNFEIVNKSYTTIKTKKIVDVDEHLRLEFTSKSKETRFIETVSQIHGINENCIAYFSKKI